MKLIVNGFEAFAYTGGKPLDPALPAIVFIHGALNDHSVWTLLARWFAHRGHAVLAVDLPGHGRSAGPVLNSIADLADWVWALLDAAGVPQKAALVGHSMGSLIALEAAARQPARASHLALLATAYPMKVSEALLNTAAAQPDKAIAMVNQFSFSSWASKPSYPGPGAWLQGGEMALKRRIQGRQTEVNLFEHDFRLCDAYSGGLEAAAKVKAPSTLILGARDQMTAPKQSKTLAEALPSAKTVMLPAGHSLMSEVPDALLAALRVALKA
ncbi:alpha/beta hydrolase [Paucibacter sp. TC2R-5]|uniref:alpha/beta fold hydrolase n=1 Tax=Paucibacter sp. TC2R-5 TaxID=2893555 RepID=UPI0021E3BA93|nr:alpha/beta hydrolase [Paucibacter sp. TC2R-5]MCV2360869.1 alpha/beta hydrolase [Paucibacter sp. TC2R-5]